ncbi:uncharacterized protein [Clytia hemisphaerica]|uniref:uncharacterized protein n=1 Tax=Clytia hemisphaerica TaxID=252671 RepID=UPI0034D43216
MLKKRKLVREIVKFDCESTATRLTWSDDIKPSWWPLDLPFVSPDVEKNKPTVHDLDKEVLAKETMPNATIIESLVNWSCAQEKTMVMLRGPIAFDCEQHNPFCLLQDTDIIKCPHCLLEYHSACVERLADCGCIHADEVEKRVKSILKEKNIQSLWTKYLPDIQKLVQKIDAPTDVNRRLKILTDQCKVLIIQKISSIPTIKRGQEELFLPEIVQLLVRKTLARVYKMTDVSNLMVQRVLF